MRKTITIVDYGMGNLHSVSRAFEHCDAQVLLTNDRREISRATHLVLPGVGAFADGMSGLSTRGLIPVIREYAHSGRPLLGICLGMQMLLTLSEEFGSYSGLDLIPGKVIAIPPVTLDGHPHKIPHTGWNELRRPSHLAGWENTILENVIPGDAVYFVHSYAAAPENNQDRLADCIYNGHAIPGAIRHELIYGCQFHPEKSGPVGLRIIKSFIAHA